MNEEVQPESIPPESCKDVPSRVFEEFLQELSKAGEDATVIEQLRRTLLVDCVYTGRALKAALLPEEPKA